MENKIDFFENGDYKFISDLLHEKMYILRNCEDFDEKYMKLYDTIDELDMILEDERKQKFNDIIELLYDIEEYYFALIYSLGIKYGMDLVKI